MGNGAGRLARGPGQPATPPAGEALPSGVTIRKSRRQRRSHPGESRRRARAAEPGDEEDVQRRRSRRGPPAASRRAHGHALLRLYFMIAPWRPARSRSRAKVSPSGPPRSRQDGADLGPVRLGQGSEPSAEGWRQMRGVAGADDRPPRPAAGRARSASRRRRCRRRAGRRSPAARRAAPGTASQPPKSSMISLYLASERFSNGGCRLGRAEPALATGSRRPPCHSRGAAMPCPRAERGEAVLRPRVEQRILHLHRDSGTPASSSASRARRVEIGAADAGRSCPRAEAPSSHSAASTQPGTA